MTALPHAIATALPHGCFAGTVHAKRKEGKGQDHTGPHRKFGVETSTTSFRNVSAQARNGVVEEIATIEHLDFTPELPCQHRSHPRGAWGHTGPAALVVSAACPGCPAHTDHLLLCRASFDFAMALGRLKCRACGVRAPVGEFWHVLEVLR